MASRKTVSKKKILDSAPLHKPLKFEQATRMTKGWTDIKAILIPHRIYYFPVCILFERFSTCHHYPLVSLINLNEASRTASFPSQSYIAEHFAFSLIILAEVLDGKVYT